MLYQHHNLVLMKLIVSYHKNVNIVPFYYSKNYLFMQAADVSGSKESLSTYDSG